MSMIDIFKNTLQEGMEVVSCKEFANKYKVTLAYKEMTGSCELGKICAPRQEKSFCKKAIDTVVSGMYINAGNLTEAKAWLDGERWNDEREEKHNTISFRVYDKDGNDVTEREEWYIDINGDLFFMTNDIDMPLQNADGFTYNVETKG